MNLGSLFGKVVVSGLIGGLLAHFLYPVIGEWVFVLALMIGIIIGMS